MSGDKRKGVVAVFVSDHGATAVSADFDNSGYGGFSLKEAQEMRAKKSMVMAVVDMYCSPDFARAIDSYAAQEIVRKLCAEHKCKIEISYIGHKEE